MKIRIGFVSNSSSSSFMLITTRETLNEVISTFNPQEREFIFAILPGQIYFELDGKKYIQFCKTIYSESMYDAAHRISEEIADRCDNIFCSFQNRFKKYKNSYIYSCGE